MSGFCRRPLKPNKFPSWACPVLSLLPSPSHSTTRLPHSVTSSTSPSPCASLAQAMGIQILSPHGPGHSPLPVAARPHCLAVSCFQQSILCQQNTYSAGITQPWDWALTCSGCHPSTSSDGTSCHKRHCSSIILSALSVMLAGRPVNQEPPTNPGEMVGEGRTGWC